MAGGRKREWIRRKMATVAGSGGRSRSRRSPRWAALRGNSFSTALWQRAGLLRLVYQEVVFQLLWVLESLVVLARLCFFFLRFGFRL
ncbi:hypothetical protein BRADI_2g15270v3 [Brachypodium distachyon]|uniref:Uncharacterized protein n=1 Tax=Brachypodium distachyon TaxID=15368 RepID=I1HG06_BRADI|nr:hypothetical protein BRADI_2g15270v3 [Brachypodium distachyon]